LRYSGHLDLSTSLNEALQIAECSLRRCHIPGKHYGNIGFDDVDLATDVDSVAVRVRESTISCKYDTALNIDTLRERPGELAGTQPWKAAGNCQCHVQCADLTFT